MGELKKEAIGFNAKNIPEMAPKMHYRTEVTLPGVWHYFIQLYKAIRQKTEQADTQGQGGQYWQTIAPEARIGAIM